MTSETITGTILQPPGDIADLAASWLRDLRARNLSPRTIQSYGEAVRLLAAYLAAQGMPTDAANVTREHVQSFISDQLARWSPATAAVRYAALRVFFRWLVDEGEVRDSPMARMRKPKLPERVTGIPSQDDLKRLLGSMGGEGFDELRDTAIVRVFLSTGARLAEVAGLRWDPADPARNDIDLDARIVRLMGKGSRERVASLDTKAVRALDRYIRRARRKHPQAALPWLWLGRKGRLTASGVSQMVRDRGAKLGLRLHPHAFRHWYAHAMLSAGHQEGDIMALAGWRSREMLARYGAAHRSDRALAAARRLSPGDEL